MPSDGPAIRAVFSKTVLVLAAGSMAAAQLSPRSNDPLLGVLRLRGEGAYERALAEAKTLAEQHPARGVVHRTIADLFLRRGELDEARSYYDRRLEKNPDDAYAHYGLGRIDFHEGDLDGAIEELTRAITLEPTFSEPVGVAGGLPELYRARRDLDTAIDFFTALASSSPDNANAFSGLGWSYARRFRFDDAIRSFARAVELEPDLTQAHHGLVQAYFRTGRYQNSLDACHALSRAAERHGDFEALAYARMMQGNIASFRGDYRTALRHLQESRAIAIEIGDEGRQASSVNNTAAVYATAGDHDKALEYFETSLELARSQGNEQTVLNALGNIGSVHKEAGRHDRAIDFYRRAAALERDSGFRSQLAATLANMAEAYQLLGNEAEATRYGEEALAIAVEIQNATIEAFATRSLGVLSRDRGDYADAVTLFERALAIGEQTGDAQAIWEARAGLASTHEKRGDVERAVEHYAQAIARYDAVRQDLAVESLGSSFLEDKYEAYPSIVALLAGQGALEEAFLYAEKSKAKGFLDILARGQTLFEAHLPENLRLELEDVSAGLLETHGELSRERSREVSDASTIVALEERIADLERRRAALLETVSTEYREFYQLALSEPLDAASIQSSVLEPGQALVEYLVGDERLSVFVLSQKTLHYREVPVGREELWRRLTELSPLFEVEGLFNSELADFSLPPAEALYQTLLAPVEDLLEGSTELVIVPDDFLFYLPFEVLILESEGAQHRYDFSAATFVVERYAISYAPSASLLDPRLKRPRRFGRGVLAFGNPSVHDLVAGTPALPNSEKEVEAIQEAFGGYDNSVLTGDEATETVFKQEAEHYGVLHFATHFLNDDRQPLYSRIVLAEDDAAGAAGDDGILQTYEIFDTKLNAELAVLSACNTGLGRLRKGEGLIGIHRAFLYAGVPSLVVSLWSVDDRATARLMQLFYQHLRSGVSKKHALRQAKLDFLSEAPEEQRDPFFWAPFVLSGDWRPLELPPESRPGRRRLAPVAIVVLLLVLALVVRATARARL